MSDDKGVFYRCYPRFHAADFGDICVDWPPTLDRANHSEAPRWIPLDLWPGLDPVTRPNNATHILISVCGNYPARYATGDVPLHRCIPTSYYVSLVPGAPYHCTKHGLGTAKVVTTVHHEYVEGPVS
jgi:hypothetical protein